MKNLQIFSRIERNVKMGCVALALTSAVVIFSDLFFGEIRAVFAQVEQPISQIEVSGNQRVSADTIRALSGLSEGVPASTGEINAAVQSLYDSGLFDTVGIRPQKDRLLIKVREYPTINEVVFEGNNRIKDEDLLGLVGSKSRDTYSPSQAEADVISVTSAYASSGRLAARVGARIIRRSENRVDLVFDVREGRVVEVSRINFTGNRNYSDSRLRREIDSKQAGLFRTFVRSDIYVPERLEFDREKLRNFYLKRGYINVKIGGSTADFGRDRDAFGVNFQVREGQQYTFGEVTVSSEVSGINLENFLKVQKIKPGRVYNPELVNTTLQRLDVIASQLDIPFIQAQPRVTRNDKTRVLDIEFVLLEGPRLFVERIDIEGNGDTLDRVIRREFVLVEGDPFNARKVQQATDAIRALRLFAKVDVQTREGSAPDQVVINVNVEEQPTGSLSFGVGFGTDDGLNGNISLSEGNFVGRGQSVGLAINTSSNNRELSFSFTEPKLFDRELRASLSVSYNEESNENLAYNTSHLVVRPSLEFPVGENTRLRTSLLVGSDEITPDAAGSTLISIETYPNSSKRQTTTGIGLRYIYDRRNSPVFPTAGFIFNFDHTLAGVLGDKEYYKAIANTKSYRSFFNEDLVFSAEVEGGYLKAFGDQGTSIVDRFRIGGNTLRGFQAAGIGPRDLTGNLTTALGGNYYAVTRLEASFPIGIPAEYGIHGGVFIDAGSVWGLDKETVPVSGGTTPFHSADSADFELRSAVGFSIFWSTALGPLRFNFSKPLQYEDGVDNIETFNFTIDTRF